MNRKLFFAACAAVFVSLATAQNVDPSKYTALQWRSIGPFRGGRVAAVTGAVGQPGVYYMGMPQGGIWKSTSAGATWWPVFDSIKDVCSVGSVQVAPSDPNVVYAGTGDGTGGAQEGNGIYRSSDAGKTWEHIGLDNSRQIPTILVDPHNPNIVLAACQGPIFEKTDTRGVYRTSDGGKTWAKTLYVDDTTGAQNIAWAFDKPDVVYASTINHYRPPTTQRRGGQAQAENTLLYKSTDKGATWTKLEGKGLPKLFGRTCLAVAQNTGGQRVYFIGMFGLYRSDDGGANWKKMAEGDQRIANGQGNYTSGVYVDPKNPDVVYTLATCAYRSQDGGKTFAAWKGAPGGDDPQQLWVDPTDGNRIFYGGDQGATVSLDAGATWGSWYNQPTAQVYNIAIDGQWPYWVYAPQQDSGAVATASRGNYGSITPFDWHPHGGFEFGSVACDPLNPNITYAFGGGLVITKFVKPTEQMLDVSPNTSENNLRAVLNQPLGFSPVNPKELFAGFQYLMSTSDGGVHWKQLSPDLTMKPGDKPQPPQMFGVRGFGDGIESFSQSTVAPGTIWAGTSNGRIQVTKDHGGTWTDVTIPNLPNPTQADIQCVDTSHTDAATAYAAVIYASEFGPHFFRTRDYGKTWTEISKGLPTNHAAADFARAIRADTKRAGLLFAGTESGMYVSFNDGDDWQSLMLNLPMTSYRDIKIHDNDLVVGTYGRGLWVLDDYSPLRELTPATTAESAHLYKPGEAIRVRRNTNGDTPLPPDVPHALNPPLGAVIYYTLSLKPAGTITLDILDRDGTPVRHMTSAPTQPINEPKAAVPDFWYEERKPLPTEIGMNRINWNIRHDTPPAFVHDISATMGAFEHDTPQGVEGPLAPPGDYTARLTVDGKTYTQSFTVKNDPRSPASLNDLRQEHDLLMNIDECAIFAAAEYEQVASMRKAVADILAAKPSDDVAKAAKDFDDKLLKVGGNPDGPRGFFALPDGSKFVGLNGLFVGLLNFMDFGDLAPTEAQMVNYGSTWSKLKTAVDKWHDLNGKDLTDFNAILTKAGLKPIAAAPTSNIPKGPAEKYLPKKPVGKPGATPKGNLSPEDIERIADGDGD